MTPSPAPTAVPAIRVERVAKTYRMWSSPGARLAAPLLYRGAHVTRRLLPRLSAWARSFADRRVHEHVALRQVDFELARGEALGIIGLNGSGKSTLLQIVAGVLLPSHGSVHLRGRVAALLELGSGFNPELTGRENIHINGAILGMSRQEIAAALPDIVAFADIGDYIDEPVKTYSSGMALRLAFAVQVHVDPEILIVDEALAVGDASFQAKAMARIDQILARGTTLLFVGHDLNAVKAFCHRAMLLEDGQVAMEGLPDEVITEYLHRTHKRALAANDAGAADRLARLSDGYGLEDARVRSATINGVQHVALRYGQSVTVRFHVRLGPDIGNPGLIFDVMDGRGLQLSGRRIQLTPVDEPAEVPVEITFEARFQQGIYRIRTRVVDAPSPERTVVLARQEGTLSFEVMDDNRALFTGLFHLPMDVTLGA